MSEAALTTSAARPGGVAHHLVTLTVENKAGVLVRIAGLFSRRGYNIVSLAVAPTDDERFSRISIVVDVESAPLQQILDQLDKLVNVVAISELHPQDAFEAELLVATVHDGGHPAQLDTLVHEFGAAVVDRGEDLATVMLSGDPRDLDRFEELLRELGIVELQRTGRIALRKLGAAS